MNIKELTVKVSFPALLVGGIINLVVLAINNGELTIYEPNNYILYTEITCASLLLLLAIERLVRYLRQVDNKNRVVYNRVERGLK